MVPGPVRMYWVGFYFRSGESNICGGGERGGAEIVGGRAARGVNIGCLYAVMILL